MEPIKKAAVYMDHFMANIIEYTNSAAIVKTIKSDFNPYEKKKIIQKGENIFNKEQDLQQQFYVKLKEELLDYNSVLLFGATNAKTQMQNILQVDKKFSDVEVTIKNTEKLSEDEQIDFVNECFYID